MQDGSNCEDLNLNEEELERCLFGALYRLMQTYTIEQVTVSDIIAEAHVSRSSFYRRYLDKYDLLIRSYRRLLDQTYLSVLGGRGYRECAMSLYQVLYSHPQFFKNALITDGPNSLSAYICEVSIGVMDELLQRHGLSINEDTRLRYIVQAYVYGTFRVTQEWARDGMPYPYDQLIEIFVELMPDPLKPYCL